jgi:xanthine dehydrogenase YagR molybdenum-binding subunit
MMSTSLTTVTRRDGPEKVTGSAHFAGDQYQPGQVYAVFVTSSIAAGRVVSIDTREALSMRGVLRVLTTADMPKSDVALEKITVPPLATRFIPMQGDEIVYEGQPVAIVLGESLEAAEAAAARVHVSYQTHAFVVPEQATSEPADPGKGNYSKSSALDFRKGDSDTALANAPVKVVATYTQPSRHANPMEPSAILAVWDGNQLTVYDAVQHLPAVQGALAAAFGMPASQVRVISPHTGGGFGAKAFVWPHEILACMAAKVIQRPVKLTLSRQHMYAMVGPQPQMTHDVALGASVDGTLLSVSHGVANVTGVTDDYVEFGAVPGRSFYACENITTSQRVRRGNMTLPTFMRSPWDGPGSWALGSAMDELARKLNMDPLDLRLRNYAENDPESGKPWSSKKLREAYAEGARRFAWSTRPKGGSRDGHWRIGCGLADCSQGQARFHSTARVRLLADGTAVFESSFCDIGTGPATIFPQIAAEVLGLKPTQVKVLSGDTNLPYCCPTYGSGTTISTGSAVQQAAQKVRMKLAQLAGWNGADVTMRDGNIIHHTESLSIQEVLGKAGLPELASDGAFNLPGESMVDMGSPEYPARTFGAIFVEVGVDPELGLLRLRRATGIYSAGRIINPLTASSQMIGGIVWGWGMAAMEASHYEPTLGRWLAKDLAGVAIPVNADIPPAIDVGFVDEFDANASPIGAKGIGELGATGVAAAVANAVFDAIGIRIRDLPITPDKILNAQTG